MSFVGRSVPRLEDRPLLTGRGRFAADVAFPHMLHMRVVRSAHAHGRIRVDRRAVPRRLCLAWSAVWTSADVRDVPPIDFRLTPHRGTGALSPAHPGRRARALCRRAGRGGVRDRSLCRRGRGRSCRGRDRGTAGRARCRARRPASSSTAASTEPAIVEKSYGDVAAAFRDAHAVVELDLAVGRHSGVPLETRGAIARYDAGATCWSFTAPPRCRTGTATASRACSAAIPRRVHLYEGHVGGGFGIRGELYPEDVLVCLAALRLGRPVKWIEDRREHLIAANHSRAAAPQGARRGRCRRPHPRASTTSSSTTRAAMCAPTRPPCPTLRRRCCRVPIACRPIGRSGISGSPTRRRAAPIARPGRFESTFVRERLMDAIAARLGIDRIEVRRRNLIAKDEMPYRAAARHARAPRSCSIPATMPGCSTRRWPPSSWDELQATCGERRRADGECVGAGLALLRREERPRPVRRRADVASITSGARRGRHRRGLARPGRRDGDRADLRRCARRRLSARARRARPHRSDRLRHGRICVARRP